MRKMITKVFDSGSFKITLKLKLQDNILSIYFGNSERAATHSHLIVLNLEEGLNVYLDGSYYVAIETKSDAKKLYVGSKPLLNNEILEFITDFLFKETNDLSI